MKKRLLLAIGMLVGLAGAALAADYADSFVITFSPLGDRGVIIATTSIAMGNLNPGTTNLIADPIPVVTTGTIADIELTMQGSITGGTVGLKPRAANYDVPLSSEVCVQASFNTIPGTLAWNAAKDILDTTAVNVGTSGTAQNGYFGGDYGAAMDHMALNASRNLFVRLLTPMAMTYSGTQTITVTVTARVGD